jgi:hypothetical protein
MNLCTLRPSETSINYIGRQTLHTVNLHTVGTREESGGVEGRIRTGGYIWEGGHGWGVKEALSYGTSCEIR